MMVSYHKAILIYQITWGEAIAQGEYEGTKDSFLDFYLFVPESLSWILSIRCKSNQ